MSKTKKVAAHHHEILKSHAKALVHATAHIADSKVSEARGKLSELIDSISESIETAEHAVVDKVKEADEYVQENPYKVAGIALGVGALIGFLVSRRKD